MKEEIKILIIGNDADCVSGLSLSMRKDGWQVYSANTGGSGLEMIRTIIPDIILLDVVLPDFQSTELFRILKSDPATAKIIIILVSEADIYTDESTQTPENGADGYMLKTLPVKEMLNRLKILIKSKQLEKALQTTEARYHGLLTSLEAGVVVHAIDTSVISCNLRATELLGLSREQMLGKVAVDPYWKFMYEDNTPIPLNDYPVMRILNSKKPIGNQIAGVCRYKNDIVWLTVNGFPVVDETGEIVEIMISFIEITDRKHAEAELRQNRNMLNTILNTIPQSVFWKDRDSRYLGCNAPFAKAAGLQNPGDIVGKTDFDLPWPKEESEAYRIDDGEVMNNNSPKPHIIEPLQQADGSRLWIDTTKIPLIDTNGSVYGVLGVYDDITEQKQAEEALREQYELSENLIETAQAAILMLDTQGRIVRFNSYLAELVGYRLDEVKGKDWFETFLKPENDQTVKSVFKKAISDLPTRGNINPVIARDGREILVEWYDKTLKDHEGNIVGLLAIGQDVTEREARKAELERLNRLYATLSQINQEVVRVNSYEELTQKVAQVAVEFGGFAIAWVGQYNPLTREVEPKCWAGERWGDVSNFRHSVAETAESRCLCSIVIGENRSCVYNDLLASPEMQGWFPVLEQAGIRAAAEVPIRVEGTVWGVFGVYDTRPDVFQNKEIALLEEAAMDIGFAIGHIRNEAQRRQAEKFQLLSTSILAILNEPFTLHESSNAILGLIKKETGLDAVGIRLKDGDDFPYFSEEGFDKEFLLAENSVILRSDTGTACRDANGQLCLQCSCGLVLAEKCGPPSDSVTAAGSLWTNNSIATVGTLSGHDPRLMPRNRCVHEGFLSVALIPIRADQQVIGLLHLNDRHKDRFTPEMIRFFEELTTSFGIAVKRKQAEEELIKAKDQAEESEIRLNQAQKVSKAGTYDWNIQENTFFWSEEFLQLFGMPNDTEAGFEAWKKALHPDDIENAMQRIQESIENQTELINEYRIILPNNEIHWIRATGQTFYENNTPVRMIGLCFDITENKKAENELKNAKERAEESDRLKSAFLANMSHEIRTPMNGILGFAELLIEPDLTGERQQRYIEMINKSGQRMLNIINDIIDISKIEAGLMELHLSESNINDQIEYIHTFFKPEAEANGLMFSVKNQLPRNEAVLTTDREKLYAILTNLVKNAIKYTHKGQIELGCQQKGSFIEFYVEDTGIGIPKDRQQAIFERFVQADIEDKMAYQGAGLGLSITKAYIEMLGGKIWVESQEGKGSTFRFTLPCVTEKEKQNNDQQHVAHDYKGEIRKLKILVVEDDEVSEQLLDETIQKFSTVFLAAKTGIEAIEMAQNNRDIDLILMDIRMPEMGGYEATKQIRQFNKEVVIIAQTAFGLAGDREKALEAGCNDYIAKPINQEKLLALMHKYFEA